MKYYHYYDGFHFNLYSLRIGSVSLIYTNGLFHHDHITISQHYFYIFECYNFKNLLKCHEENHLVNQHIF